MKKAMASVVVSCALAVSASAVTRKVRSEYPSIQLAIQDCRNGDTVLVSPGLYCETINFVGKNITVTSTDPNDPKIVGYTVINADGDGSVVTFANGETSAAVLTGFTITGGRGTINNTLESKPNCIWGGGIYCIHASPTITRNIITRNYGPTDGGMMVGGLVQVSYGGGIAALFCSPTITHNIIRNNTALYGGGVMNYEGDSLISNNIISDNSGYIGAGVCLLGGSIINNTIAGNDIDKTWPGPSGGTGLGGNVLAIYHPPYVPSRIIGNIISNAASGGGIYCIFSQGSERAPDLFQYNDVWNNAPGDWITNEMTGTQTDGPSSPTGTMGNISVDPLFVSPFNKDYHLTLESPCIDAGDADWSFTEGQIDIDGQRRVHGARIDIGADEFLGYVKPVAVAGFDQHLLAPFETVTLDGSGSLFFDPCSVRAFRWTQVKGTPVALSDPNSASPTFVPEAMGEYGFELVVADDRYSSTPDGVIVLVGGNQPPVASAGADTVFQTPGEVTLDGTGSYDPDGVDRLRYAWKQVGGPAVELRNADTATPSFTCNVRGQYAFELVVNDGFVDSSPSRTTVTAVGIARRR